MSQKTTRILFTLLALLFIVLGVVSLVIGDWLNAAWSFALAFPWALEQISQRFAPRLTRGKLGWTITIAYIVVVMVLVYLIFIRQS